jgi:peptidoglycan/LPS O-acetylase OafA/YrhL
MARLRCLDGLRGVLASYVAIAHIGLYLDWPAALGGIRRALLHGEAAVDLFFALSGLVIFQSLARFKGHPGAFLRARWWRTYPAYAAGLALALAVQPLAGGALPWLPPRHFDIWPQPEPIFWPRLLTHVTMLHGLTPEVLMTADWAALYGAAWSLSTEWQFYALAALLMATARPALLPRRCLAVLSTLAVLGVLLTLVAPPDWQMSRAFLPHKAAYFALGIASARLLDRAPGAIRIYALTIGLTGLTALPQWDKLLTPLIWTLVLAAQYGAAPLAPLRRLLCARPLQALGLISYSLYLVNEPLQKLAGIAAARAAGGDGTRFDLLFIPTGIALSLAGAWALHRVVERRFQHGPDVSLPLRADESSALPKTTPSAASASPNAPRSRPAPAPRHGSGTPPAPCGSAGAADRPK